MANGRIYHEGPATVLLYVADYGEYKVDGDAISMLSGKNATIAGVNGILNHDGNYYTFNYPKDGKLVVITTNDKSVIGDFIVA